MEAPSDRIAYLDASAIVKLVVEEPESEPLVEALRALPAVLTSEISRVEVMRAARRCSDDALVEARATEVLVAIPLLRLQSALLDAAAALDPRSLRTLDAIHLAAALSLGEDLGLLVAYDARLIAAARARGIRVLSPGLESTEAAT